MALAHSQIECKGCKDGLSQVVLTFWLGSTDTLCQLHASQATSKDIGMRMHCSLPLFPQPHLKTQDATKAGFHSWFGLHGSCWHPPKGANNCDTQKTSHDGFHMGQFAALNQTKCTRAPTKVHCSPAEAVLVRKWVALPGFSEIVGMHPLAWMYMILTKANM